MIEIHENIYGHRNRVEWFKKLIDKEKKGLEFGCGTGIMISAFLLQEGYDIYGIDLDDASIKFGQKVFEENGLDPDRLLCKNLSELPDNSLDYILASEVFEHIHKVDIDEVLVLIRKKLRPNGHLIVTVPNGFGWFELEALFWHKLGIGFIIEKLYLSKVIYGFKEKILGVKYNHFPSTVAHSPHVRRFTLNSIGALLSEHSFVVKEKRGSVFFAGPFSALIFSGLKPFISFNLFLGKCFPSIASGFYLYSIKS